MTELFANIPQRVREQTNFWVDFVFSQKNTAKAIEMLEEYRNSCLNEEEKEYLDFIVNIKAEQIQENL